MAFRRFKVNWVLKANIFNVLDCIPCGNQLYYLLQRYVTKTVPRILVPTAVTGKAQISHAVAFKQHGIDLSKAHFVEFGAGWDLYSNMIMYCMGVDKQYVIDIRRWARAEAINAVINYLKIDPPAGHVRFPGRLVREESLEEDLRNFYGIGYHAPADASKIPVADGTFNLTATTSTLEHIPPSIIRAILKESFRVLAPGSLMRHVIDYSDHYAHADPNINEFNYLRFSEQEWQKFNPGIHYQNRLRTKSYLELFKECGFEVVEVDTWKGKPEDLQKVQVHEVFRDLTQADLLELGGNFLLRRP